MCKSLEIMRLESEIKGSINGSIKAFKSLNVSDEKTVAYLLENYDCLSEEDAKNLVKEYEA